MEQDKLKELYGYSLNALEIILERKRHLEIKCLSVLQATAVLITLFFGFTNKMGIIKAQKIQVIILKDSFYMTILITLILLLVVLNDSIVNVFKKKDEGLKDEGLFEDIPLPNRVLHECTEHTLNDFHINIIINISNSIESAKRIISIKVLLFNWILFFFILSIIILIFMGFIII